MYRRIIFKDHMESNNYEAQGNVLIFKTFIY